MNEIIVICVILFTVSVIVATVYFVITMIQIAETAKKTEEVLTKINTEMDKIQKISGTVTDVLNLIPKSLIGVVTSVVSLFFKNKQ